MNYSLTQQDYKDLKYILECNYTDITHNDRLKNMYDRLIERIDKAIVIGK